MALFESREDFDRRMDDAGLTNESCAYRAANALVGFAGGIDIHSEQAVRREFATIGNEPLIVEIDSKSPDLFKRKADIMCAACGMCVTLAGAFTDAQKVVLGKDSRECPVFETIEPVELARRPVEPTML